jgi:hypothetical protein
MSDLITSASSSPHRTTRMRLFYRLLILNLAVMLPPDLSMLRHIAKKTPLYLLLEYWELNSPYLS